MNSTRREQIREIIEELQIICDEESDAQSSRPDSLKETTEQGQKSDESCLILDSVISELKKVIGDE